MMGKKYKRFLEVKEHKVEFNTIKFLTQKSEYIDLAPPRPSKEFIPAWYKNLQREWTEMRDGKHGEGHDESWNSVPYKDNSLKKCPTVKDIMHEGYIIPLWLDLKISHTKETGFNWYNKHAFENTITFHDARSIGKMPMMDHSFNTALKFENPWDIITPPGWSVLIMDPWYHRNTDIEIMPSIVETDSYHQMNIPFLYHGTGEKIFRQGTPLIHVIPFKRETLSKLEVAEMDELDEKYYDKSRAAERTRQNGFYRWLTQQNKKIWKEQGIIDE
jgi:hypothetical protein